MSGPGAHSPTNDSPTIILSTIGSVFTDRAQRFRALARNGGIGGYLNFLALLCDAQEKIRRQFEKPCHQEIRQEAAEFGFPILNHAGLRRDPIWLQALRSLVSQLNTAAVPETTRLAMDELADMEDSLLEAFADAILAGEFERVDARYSVFIGATLQVYWSCLAAQIRQPIHCDAHTPGLCPVCASVPVASALSMGATPGQRYLHCGLCDTRWHLPRIRCVICNASESVVYLSDENAGKASVKAEACQSCKAYLKIFYPEADSGIEPLADDIASLALDLAMNEAGYSRIGANLLLPPQSA